MNGTILTRAERHAQGSPQPDARITFHIHGLVCAAEAIGLERRLTHQHGVADVTVNPVTETAYIDYDPRVINPAELKQRIADAGYKAVEH